MKKVLLLLGLALSSISLSFAQAPQKMLQKSGNATLREGEDGGEEEEKGPKIILPEGFTYANRKNAAQGMVSGFGVMYEVGFPMTGAIELPNQAGQIIKGISYHSSSEDKKGKIFIASRPKSAGLDEYTILQIKRDIETHPQVDGITTAEFDTPVTTEAGKLYAIGYEVMSSEEAPSVISFVKDKKFHPGGNLVTFNEDKSPSIEKVGSKLEFTEVSDLEFGNLAIVVHGDKLASANSVTSDLQPVVYAQEGRIFVTGTNDGFSVYDMKGELVAVDSSSVLPAGSYIVKTRCEQTEHTSKVIVK